jgi:hypothetical protein
MERLPKWGPKTDSSPVGRERGCELVGEEVGEGEEVETDIVEEGVGWVELAVGEGVEGDVVDFGIVGDCNLEVDVAVEGLEAGGGG